MCQERIRKLRIWGRTKPGHRETNSLFPPDLVDPGSNRRRPADVYVPSWQAGRPAALDIAVTSPQRADALLGASQRSGAAAEGCEQQKRTHLGTEQDCNSAGISFIPVVLETSGGLGPSAMHVVKTMAKSTIDAHNDGKNILRSHLEVLCTAVRRANARAVLRRNPDVNSGDGGIASALCFLQS